MSFRIVVVFLCFMVSCNDAELSNRQVLSASDSGKQLVNTYCSSCHLAVLPAALNKTSWLRNVLPAMAPKLGISVWNGNQYFPSKDPKIPFSDWTKLVEYFRREAPDSLATIYSQKRLESMWLFTVEKPVVQSPSVATTLMVAADTLRNLIYSSDHNGDLFTWSSSLELEKTTRLPSPAIQLISSDTTTALTLIGAVEAIDRPMGMLGKMDLQQSSCSGADLAAATIADKLPRPVQSIPVDFNRDRLVDWLVCGFGHEEGALLMLTQTAPGQFTRSTIRNVPGASQVQTGDFNNDGWLDFLCLFAHADEGIWLFTNDRKGGFSQQNILRFPPQYGSTSFQLFDFNGDGRLDILYSCGDNSDYSRVLKPFHGIYIFLNNGGWTFEKKWFYHVNGCTKVVAADFDKDGDPDIAGIAFFADLRNDPDEKFLLFRQDSFMHFTTISPSIKTLGRWISMEIADTDHDGDKDILLGNYSRGFINQSGVLKEWDHQSPFILLRNTFRN